MGHGAKGIGKIPSTVRKKKYRCKEEFHGDEK